MQMLRFWLPGLVQLELDHDKVQIEKDTDIAELLDDETGLRNKQKCICTSVRAEEVC